MSTSDREGSSLKEARRRAQDAISRTHILDAAERVFTRNGFSEATLREIAAEAEFSVGAIYNFFPSKEDLFAKVMGRKGELLVQALDEAIQRHGGPVERLHAIADAQVFHYARHQAFYRLFLRTAGPSWWSLKAQLDETSGERFHRAIDMECKLFEEGIATGDFRDDEEPEAMAVYLLGLVQAYAARWLFDPAQAVPSSDGNQPPLGPPEARARLHELIDRAFLR